MNHITTIRLAYITAAIVFGLLAYFVQARQPDGFGFLCFVGGAGLCLLLSCGQPPKAG